MMAVMAGRTETCEISPSGPPCSRMQATLVVRVRLVGLVQSTNRNCPTYLSYESGEPQIHFVVLAAYFLYTDMPLRVSSLPSSSPKTLFCKWPYLLVGERRMDQAESGSRCGISAGARRMIPPQKWLSSFARQKCFLCYDSRK